MIKEYLKKYQEELKKCINDLKHKDTFYKQIPNLLTFSRAAGMIPVNILFFTGNTIPAIMLTGLLLITDFFDGRYARKHNIVSKFGADLDAVCDKVMFLGLSLPLMFHNPVLIANFLLEAIISCINVYGRMKGIDTKTVLSGKIKTWFLSGTLISGYLVHFFNLPVILLSVISSMTVGTQVLTINNYVEEYKKMMKEKTKQTSTAEKKTQETESSENSHKQSNSPEYTQSQKDELIHLKQTIEDETNNKTNTTSYTRTLKKEA